MYGDGSDGALNVTSGTTNLNLDQKYEYTTVNVSAGAKISTTDTAGSVLYICATTSINIDGIIDLYSKMSPGQNSWSVTIDGVTYNSPSVGNGGSGGDNFGRSGGSQSNGYGGGGAGGGQDWAGSPDCYGGNGGSGGTSPSGGGYRQTGSGNSEQILSGNNGSQSGGGSGGAMKTSGNWVYRSGVGGGSHGENGGNASRISGSGSYWGVGGGGGGAGGAAGRPGVHLVLKAPSITINGELMTAGTDGGSGGRGGSGSDGGYNGSGGGGGGGGNGGSIYVTTDSFSGITSHITNGGSGGAGGGNAYENGDAGTTGIDGDFILDTGGLFPNGYEFRKPLTIDHTKVGSFTGKYRALVKHTDADLKSVANGGKVHLNPLVDIRFEDDSGNKLAHEMVDYDPSTGAIEAWVRLDSLTNASDTVFWIYYGKDLEASSYQGIRIGYASATRMVLERNYYDGAENQGELTPWISGLTDPDGNSIDQPDGNSVATNEDGALTTGWIMYSATDTHTRFTSNAGSWNNHLIAVAYVGGQWYYDDNQTLISFTPESTDFLIAEASWGRTPASGRAFNYIGKRPAGEEIPWMVWADDVAVGQNIDIVSNRFREVNHLNSVPEIGYSQPSIDRFGMNFTTFGSMGSGNVVDGKVGKALDFDGSNDLLRAKKDVIWHASGVGYVSMWFKMDSTSSTGCLFSRRSGVSAGDGIAIFLISGALRVDFAGGSSNQFTTGWTGSAGVWYHLAAQTDGSTQRVYINGSQVASRSGVGWATGGDYPHVQIGASISDATNSGNYFDGQIDEFRLYADTAREAGFFLTEYNNQNSPTTFYSVGVAQSNLDVDSTSHGHTVDSVTLSEHSELTVNEALHSHTVDGVTIVQDYKMTVAESLHGHSVDSIVLEVPYPTPNDTLHAHTADSVVLVEHKTLATADTSHSHTADGVGLTEHIELSIENTLHLHIADNTGITQEGQLGVQDSTHGHTADNLTIVQFNGIKVQGADHSHTVDNIDIVENIDIVVQNTTHGHTVDGSLILPQDYHLGVSDGLHVHTSDSVTLHEKFILQMHESTHSHTVDNIQVSTGVELANVEETRHVHTADNIVLTQKHTIQTANTRHKLLIEALQRIIDWTAMGVGFGGYLKFYKSVGQIDEAEPNYSGQSTQVDESDTYKESHKETGNYY